MVSVKLLEVTSAQKDSQSVLFWKLLWLPPHPPYRNMDEDVSISCYDYDCYESLKI